MYIKKEYIAGATIDTYKITYKPSKKGQRSKRRRPTPEDVRLQNELLALDKAIRIINANFKTDDFHIILTFKPDKRPSSAEEGKKIFDKLLRIMRKEYRKAGKELKWASAAGFLQKDYVDTEKTSHNETVPHFHMIVNAIDYRIWTAAWRENGRAMIFPLDERGDYSALAAYLFEHSKNSFKNICSPFKQRITHSRNLIIPPVKRKRIKASSWSDKPKPIKGYYIDTDSVRMGVSTVTGFPYMFYRQIKIDPRE